MSKACETLSSAKAGITGASKLSIIASHSGFRLCHFPHLRGKEGSSWLLPCPEDYSKHLNLQPQPTGTSQQVGANGLPCVKPAGYEHQLVGVILLKPQCCNEPLGEAFRLRTPLAPLAPVLCVPQPSGCGWLALFTIAFTYIHYGF